jgi:hypothetical protein
MQTPKVRAFPISDTQLQDQQWNYGTQQWEPIPGRDPYARFAPQQARQPSQSENDRQRALTIEQQPVGTRSPADQNWLDAYYRSRRSGVVGGGGVTGYE